jgi:hypothetical protein
MSKRNGLFFALFGIQALVFTACSPEPRESFDVSPVAKLENSVLSSGACTPNLEADVATLESFPPTAREVVEACRRLKERHLPGIQCQLHAHTTPSQMSTLKVSTINTSDYHSYCAPVLQKAGPRSFSDNGRPVPLMEVCTNSFENLYDRLKKWGPSTMGCLELKDSTWRTFACRNGRGQILRSRELWEICSK